MSRTTGHGPSWNHPDERNCVVCGGTADGIDARILEPICERCALLHLDADLDADDVDRGDGPVTDGGVVFEDRVDEMIEEIEAEVDDSTPAEAMLYARCSAAFEDTVNNTDLPPENAPGVVTAALFEAADTAGYARSDVIEDYRRVNRPDASDEQGRRPLITTTRGRMSISAMRDTVYRMTRPCECGECPHDLDPDACEAMQTGRASKCPSSRAPNDVRAAG
jgi:hypothetical protein